MIAQLLLASNNEHKHKEFTRLFPGVTVLTPRQAGLELDFPEDGATFFENAHGKAEALYRLAGRPVVADDSGLCVDSLGGSRGSFPPGMARRREARPWRLPRATATCSAA